MDINNDLKMQIEQLRQRSLAATTEELNSLLDEAKSLYTRTRSTELESDAREVYRNIREKQSSPTESPSGFSNPDQQFIGRIERERAKVAGGDSDELREAVGNLGEILRTLGTGVEKRALRMQALEVLNNIANKTGLLRTSVNNALAGLPPSEETTQLLNQLRQPPTGFFNQSSSAFSSGSPSSSNSSSPYSAGNPYPADPPPPASPQTPPPVYGDTFSSNSSSSFTGGGVEDMMNDARKKFYAGDYYEAINLFSEVLRREPNNAEAKQRLVTCEDNIRRGVVPDNKIPYESRVAFGRAQSLERAEQFEESRELYKLALDEASRQVPELKNWSVALDALVNIETLIIARQTRNDADKLAREDKWSDAIEKYEAVLRLKENDSKAKQSLELLRKAKTQSENVRVQLTLMTGSPLQKGKLVVELLTTIRQLRPQMPDSKLLSSIDSEVQARARDMRESMLERANYLMMQSSVTPAIADRKRMITEASTLLDYVLDMSSGSGSETSGSEPEIFELSQRAATELAELSRAESALIEARKLINSDTDMDRKNVKAVLAGLRGYNQDPLNRQLVGALLRQYLEQAENALRNKQYPEAEQWIKSCQDEPFKILGSNEETWRLQNRLDKARRGQWLKWAGYFAGGVVILFILIGMTRSAWSPILFPAPTATVTMTPIIPTITATVEIDDTPTPAPSLTPTPPPCYGAIKGLDNGYATARMQPDRSSGIAFSMQTAELAIVLNTARDGNNTLWYEVSIVRGTTKLIGWVEGRYINSQCLGNN